MTTKEPKIGDVLEDSDGARVYVGEGVNGDGWLWLHGDTAQRLSALLQPKYMECPMCGDPCRTLPGKPPTEDFPDGYWSDGERTVCQCGARLVVFADGEEASLCEVPKDEATWRPMSECPVPTRERPVAVKNVYGGVIAISSAGELEMRTHPLYDGWYPLPEVTK